MAGWREVVLQMHHTDINSTDGGHSGGSRVHLALATSLCASKHLSGEPDPAMKEPRVCICSCENE